MRHGICGRDGPAGPGREAHSGRTDTTCRRITEELIDTVDGSGSCDAQQRGSIYQARDDRERAFEAEE